MSVGTLTQVNNKVLSDPISETGSKVKPFTPSKAVTLPISVKVYTVSTVNGLEPILPVKQSVAIGTMINLEGDGHGDGVGRCKQSLAFQIFT